MTNIYFKDEEITNNDLYFLCFMIERVARKLHQRNKYVVNAIGRDHLKHLISVADVLHCENPESVEDRWIDDYNLLPGNFDIEDVDHELVTKVPRATQMGKVYTRLITDTIQEDEDYIDALIRVYNDPICEVIDNYNASAYYEPSNVIARAYFDGEFT